MPSLQSNAPTADSDPRSPASRAGSNSPSGPALAGQAGRILVVDDHVDMRDFLDDALRMRGFTVHTTGRADEALALVRAEDFDAVITDWKLSGMDGIELCSRIRECCPDVPVILITGFGSLDAAVAAMRAGAFDFITKPIELPVLEMHLGRALQHRTLTAEVKRLRSAVASARAQDSGGLIGQSAEMMRLFDLIDRVAQVDASVLITGETGSGKEVVARALHQRSERRSGPFVALNCAALPKTLLESELFGHEKGAFTDARARRAGLFVQANGGTIFLDEIGEMPLDLQPKLLRALQDKMVRPLGGTMEVSFDARLITATNIDLEEAVREGRFREDLYFRINVIQLPLPPLRARGEDVLLLAQHFVAQLAKRLGKNVNGMRPEVAERLLAYAWPGNVRELSNCIERAVALTRYDHLTLEDLPEKVRQARSRTSTGSHLPPAAGAESAIEPRPGDPLPTMDELERRHIMRVLEAVRGNKAEAARVLGFDRRTLYRKLERMQAEGHELPKGR